MWLVFGSFFCACLFFFTFCFLLFALVVVVVFPASVCLNLIVCAVFSFLLFLD